MENTRNVTINLKARSYRKTRRTYTYGKETTDSESWIKAVSCVLFVV